MELVRTAYNYYQRLYNGYLWTLTLAEPHVQSWPLVKSPVPMFALIFIYYNIVYFGPKYMKNREPWKLKWVLVFYNVGIALLNLYICIGVFYNATILQYSYTCEPYHPIKSQEEKNLAGALWWYWFSKLIEFADTIFFIVRKKDRQLTFLHVYHHSTMFFLWWIGIKWVPTGASFIGAGLNAIVHVFMYAYYGLSALGPRVRKYLWWKKYLTLIQLAQFTLALCLGINGIRVNCDFPKWMQYTLVTYMVSFIILFSNFYTQTYTRRRSALKKKDDDYANGFANGALHLTNGSVHSLATNHLSNSRSSELINNEINQENNLHQSKLINGSAVNGKSNGIINNGIPNGVKCTANGRVNGISVNQADMKERKIIK